MTSSSQSVSGREIVYNLAQFFKKQKEEQKLNTNITAVTSEATRVSRRLVSRLLYLKKVKNLLIKENYASLHLRERKVRKKQEFLLRPSRNLLSDRKSMNFMLI